MNWFVKTKRVILKRKLFNKNCECEIVKHIKTNLDKFSKQNVLFFGKRMNECLMRMHSLNFNPLHLLLFTLDCVENYIIAFYCTTWFETVCDAEHAQCRNSQPK